MSACNERDEQIIRQGLAALPPAALAAFARALHARDWGDAIAILRTNLAELKERHAALRDHSVTLAVQQLEVDAQSAALDVLLADAARHEKRSRWD
jgi:hypothetical protein